MKRPTVSIIQDTRRIKKDNTYPIKIRITYNRQQKYWYTGLDLTENEFKEAMAEKPKKTFLKHSEKLKGHKRNAENIIDQMKDFSFSEFELKSSGNTKSIQNVYSFYEEYIAELKKENRIGTAKSYSDSLSSLKTYKSNLAFKDVDSKFLKNYEKWMIEKGRSITTVGIYLRCLRTLFNKAIAENLLSQENYPFHKHTYIIPAARNIKKALTIDEVKKIIDYPAIPGSQTAFAKDIWTFSYISNGMNIKDIAFLKVKNIDGEYLRFVRAKTARSTRSSQATIVVFLLPIAKEIIKNWQNKEANSEDFIFPILKHGLTSEQQFKVIQQAIKQINKYIKRIAKDVNINKAVTTYFARHSYASVLKNLGVSIEYISESLGHQNIATTKSYLESFQDDTKKKMASLLVNF
jgi:site-specific recombinase XerD